jgi:tetratricopeptide (TPR) repeat protein
MTALAQALDDPDPLVRHAAVDALAGLPDEQRIRLLAPRLSDPVRSVRVAAARWLAGVPANALDAAQIANRQRALDEYVTIQRFNADRPESYNNLGTLYADQGNWQDALAALEKAMSIDPALAISSLNLADLYQKMGHEDEAQILIRKVLQRNPRDALATHALGLSLLRQNRNNDALQALHRASQLEPGNARFAYVYAVALEGAGQRDASIGLLKDMIKQQPENRDALQALVSFCRRLPNEACAKYYSEKLFALQ